MVTIKKDDEIEMMRRTGKLAAEVLLMIAPYIKPGVTTNELNDRCHEFIIKNGATPAPLNYRGFPLRLYCWSYLGKCFLFLKRHLRGSDRRALQE